MSIRLTQSASTHGVSTRADMTDLIADTLGHIETEAGKRGVAVIWDTLEIRTETVCVDDRTLLDLAQGRGVLEYRSLELSVRAVFPTEVAS